MNQFYEIVEKIINLGSAEFLNDLIIQLNQNPGNQSLEFSCGENVFYVLKRLCAASLARDQRIKNNVEKALTQIKVQVTDLTKINKSVFSDSFLSSTDMADCKTKQEKNSYIQGKIIIAKIMSEYLKDEKIISHFVNLLNETEILQQQLIQVLQTLTESKLSGLKLKTTSPNAKLLIEILTKKSASSSDIDTILTNAIEEYPNESVTLKHLGLNFEHIVASPSQFFKSHYAKFISVNEQETEDGDLKKLYYLLQIQKYFLSNVEISQQNISKFLCIEMIIAWLQQLRVKNKHMKKLTNSIKINFDSDADFSFHVLKYLHEQKMYLQNISANHPFASLYRNVEPQKFWSYLIELIKQEKNKEESNDEFDEDTKSKKEEYLSQLEYITRQNIEVLTPQQIGETLTILIKAFQASKKSEKLLNLIWSLFHKLLERSEKKKSKKKIVLNPNGPLILSKIKLNELQMEPEILQTISKAIKFIRIKVKAHKQSEDKVVISFLNFVTGLIVYCIVYPEESDVCAEIEFIFKDLESLLGKDLSAKAEQDILKKKRKKSQEVVEDPKKAIHVLVDVFISLLTKAPIFLRNSINLVFEQFVPFIQTSDLDTLLDVIQKPDQEYIEEI